MVFDNPRDGWSTWKSGATAEQWIGSTARHGKGRWRERRVEGTKINCGNGGTGTSICGEDDQWDVHVFYEHEEVDIWLEEGP